MWAFTGIKDPMRLQVPSLPSKMLRTVLQLLTGDPTPTALPADKCLLYQYSNGEDFARQMPFFNMWGLHPMDLEGPHENPIFMDPVLVDLVVRAPDVVAGGRTPPGTPGATAGEQMPSGAP